MQNADFAAKAYAYYASTRNDSGLIALLREAGTENIASFARARLDLTRLSPESKRAYLDLVSRSGIDASGIKTLLGSLSSAIRADDPDLFAAGVACNDIRIEKDPAMNHQFIEAINKCGPKCRDLLAGLLREAVRDLRLSNALQGASKSYATPQIKVLIVLDAFGVELDADQSSAVKIAIHHESISNHARLHLSAPRKNPERLLLIDPKRLTLT